MKSYMPRKEDLEREWYVIDAEDKVVGRLASEIVKVLSGKNKPIYTPHLDTGDYVIVINADKMKLTGKKLEQGSYKYHTLHPGGLKEVSYKQMMNEKPERLLEIAVKGMLPKNKIGRKMVRKLKIYSGSEHNHEAQQPKTLEI